MNNTIYLADDDREDRLLMTEAMADQNLNVNIIQVTDGSQLITSIREADASMVSLILLDMNMPRMNGLEALSILKSDPNLSSIPIVMITTTSDKRLMASAYSHGVDSFVTKPYTYQGYTDLVKFLKEHFKL